MLARAARLVPADAYGWASLSLAETRLAVAGRLEKDQPFRSLDEALRLDPANVTFRTAGANAALELGDLERARRYADEAATVLPDFAPARAQLAHVAAREGRLEDAIRLLREAMALEWYGQTEAHHVAQANLASLLLRAGRLEEAEQEARALARKPRSSRRAATSGRGRSTPSAAPTRPRRSTRRPCGSTRLTAEPARRSRLVHCLERDIFLPLAVAVLS